MNLNLTPATRYGLNILGLVGITVAMTFGASIFLPVTIAALLAACLWPAAQWLHQRLRLPWFVCCVSVILIMCLLFASVFLGFATAVPQLVEDLKPQDYKRQVEIYDKLRTLTLRASPFPIDERTIPVDAEQSGVFQQIKATLDGQRFTDFLIETIKAGGKLLWQGILVLFIVLFMLLEGEMLARKVKAMFGPAGENRKKVAEALSEMAESVRTYLVWRTIINFALAIALGMIYKACGLKQWYLWALITAILTYIPYLGPIVAGVLPVLDALVFNDNPAVGIGLGFFYLGVVTFEGYVIVPWLMGRKMNLNATTVMAGCLYWDYVWGTAGLFLAMPLMSALKAICLNVEGWGDFGRLMGSEDDADPPLVVELKPAPDALPITDASKAAV
jgi:AI-2 transport protein TqsA